MAPMIRTAPPRESENDPATLTCVIVVDREPDADVPEDELCWWLDCQKAETRAALAAAGLL